MNFNLDTSKQAQEVISSRKVKVTAYRQLVFNDNPVVKPQLKSMLGGFSISR